MKRVLIPILLLIFIMVVPVSAETRYVAEHYESETYIWNTLAGPDNFDDPDLISPDIPIENPYDFDSPAPEEGEYLSTSATVAILESLEYTVMVMDVYGEISDQQFEFILYLFPSGLELTFPYLSHGDSAIVNTYVSYDEPSTADNDLVLEIVPYYLEGDLTYQMNIKFYWQVTWAFVTEEPTTVIQDDFQPWGFLILAIGGISVIACICLRRD